MKFAGNLQQGSQVGTPAEHDASAQPILPKVGVKGAQSRLLPHQTGLPRSPRRSCRPINQSITNEATWHHQSINHRARPMPRSGKKASLRNNSLQGANSLPVRASAGRICKLDQAHGAAAQGHALSIRHFGLPHVERLVSDESSGRKTAWQCGGRLSAKSAVPRGPAQELLLTPSQWTGAPPASALSCDQSPCPRPGTCRTKSVQQTRCRRVCKTRVGATKGWHRANPLMCR